jgi:hypothetical protein
MGDCVAGERGERSRKDSLGEVVCRRPREHRVPGPQVFLDGVLGGVLGICGRRRSWWRSGQPGSCLRHRRVGRGHRCDGHHLRHGALALCPRRSGFQPLRRQARHRPRRLRCRFSPRLKCCSVDLENAFRGGGPGSNRVARATQVDSCRRRGIGGLALPLGWPVLRPEPDVRRSETLELGGQ